jgi:hypothetical protein
MTGDSQSCRSIVRNFPIASDPASEVREQAIERADQGQTITLADAERMVEEAAHEAAKEIPEKVEEMREKERREEYAR